MKPIKRRIGVSTSAPGPKPSRTTGPSGRKIGTGGRNHETVVFVNFAPIRRIFTIGGCAPSYQIRTDRWGRHPRLGESAYRLLGRRAYSVSVDRRQGKPLLRAG